MQKLCPFQQEENICGEWCPLFDLEQRRCELSLFRKEVANLVAVLKDIKRLMERR